MTHILSLVYFIAKQIRPTLKTVGLGGIMIFDCECAVNFLTCRILFEI